MPTRCWTGLILSMLAACGAPFVTGEPMTTKEAERYVQWKASRQGWGMVRCPVDASVPEGRFAVRHPGWQDNFAIVSEGLALLPAPVGSQEALLLLGPETGASIRWPSVSAATWTECDRFHGPTGRLQGVVVEMGGAPMSPLDPFIDTLVEGCGLQFRPGVDGTFELRLPPTSCALHVWRSEGRRSVLSPDTAVTISEFPGGTVVLVAPAVPGGGRP